MGLSLWSFANSGVGAATQSYSEVITDIGKFTSDRFVIVNVAYEHPSTNAVTVWIYNSGESPTDISDITLTCKDCASFVPVSAGPADLTGTNPIPAKSLQELSFDSGSLTAGNTYQFHVLSGTGAFQSFFQEYNVGAGDDGCDDDDDDDCGDDD